MSWRWSGWFLMLALAAMGCTRQSVPLALLRDVHFVDLSKADGPPTIVPLEQKPYHCLALSGGGVYGAFGIGVLNGWTESGTRPEFDVVTGISSGALIATFAFLGPDHDAALANIVIEEGDRRDLMRRIPLVFVPFADAFYTSKPLGNLIDRSITLQILQKVAEAHARGRRLYIGSSDLDSRRLVIWDMGAIASRGTPEALELYRRVVRASSAVPAAFPAIKIPVVIDGKTYHELHVDGGVNDEILFRTSMIAEQNRLRGLPGMTAPPGSALYVINHGKVYPDPHRVKKSLLNILGATASSLLHSKTREEIRRIACDCQHATSMSFHLTALPQDLEVNRDAFQLKRQERERLYEAGREAGRQAGHGSLWFDHAPGSLLAEQETPREGNRFSTSPQCVTTLPSFLAPGRP